MTDMSKQTEAISTERALKLALEALEVATTPFARDRQEVLRAQAALREALTSVPDWASEAKEQPAPATELREQEPVTDRENAIIRFALHQFMSNAYSHMDAAAQDKDGRRYALDAVERFAKDAKDAEALLSRLQFKAPQPAQQQEPVAWISVKDALPKAVRGVSYNASLTDVVLVRHSDRPDYPITAHAVVGEGLGAGIAIPTEGASEHPEIAWYSASSNLNNPFDLKNDDYDRYLPKVFGSKITHWKPIDTSPPAQRTWVGLTEFDIDQIPYSCSHADSRLIAYAIEAKLKEKNT